MRSRSSTRSILICEFSAAAVSISVSMVFPRKTVPVAASFCINAPCFCEIRGYIQQPRAACSITQRTFSPQTSKSARPASCWKRPARSGSGILMNGKFENHQDQPWQRPCRLRLRRGLRENTPTTTTTTSIHLPHHPHHLITKRNPPLHSTPLHSHHHHHRPLLPVGTRSTEPLKPTPTQQSCFCSSAASRRASRSE